MDEQKIEFTKSEKMILKMMFDMADSIFYQTDAIYLKNGEYFDTNDLFFLREKLGIED